MAVFRRFLCCHRLFVTRQLSGSNRSITSLHKYCTTTSANKDTHFGYETVTEAEKDERVYKVFEGVAGKYDLMNDAMSLGIHRCWKDHFVKQLGLRPGVQHIDVAGGTGDIAFRILDHLQKYHPLEKATGDESRVPESLVSNVTVCDINDSMLEVGQKRAAKLELTSGLSWLKGNAENLPVEDNSFDSYTVAFGIRNVTHVDQVLKEACRVLKPGGQFMCLEFSQVSNPLVRALYDQYSFQLIPVMGMVIAGDWRPYQYLVESIRKFPKQEVFADMIRSAGFRAVNFENLSMGIVAIHSGYKV